MLRANLIDNYFKVGNDGSRRRIFVWEVTGGPKDLEQYQTDQGANFRANDASGKPMFFSQEFPGSRNGVELKRIQLKDGTIRYKLDDMDKVLRIESIKEEKEAEIAVQRALFGAQRAIPVATPAITAKAEEVVAEPTGAENLGEAL